MYFGGMLIGLYSIWRPPYPMKSHFFESIYLWRALNFECLILEIYSKFNF